MDNTDTMVCGLCRWYDSDMCFCEKHPEYGEIVEMDTCYRREYKNSKQIIVSDYEELP